MNSTIPDPIERKLERAAADAGVAWKEGRGSGEDMHVAIDALIAHRAAHTPKADLEPLLLRLELACSAACSCETKTHEIQYHAPICRFRVLREAIDEINGRVSADVYRAAVKGRQEFRSAYREASSELKKPAERGGNRSFTAEQVAEILAEDPANEAAQTILECRPPAEHEGGIQHAVGILRQGMRATESCESFVQRIASAVARPSPDQETLDHAAIGRSLVATIDANLDHPALKGWAPAGDYAEIVGDLLGMLDARPSPEGVQVNHIGDVTDMVGTRDGKPDIALIRERWGELFPDGEDDEFVEDMTFARWYAAYVSTFKSPPSPPGEQVDPTDEAIDKWQAEFVPMSTASEISPFVLRAIVRSALTHFQSPARTVQWNGEKLVPIMSEWKDEEIVKLWRSIPGVAFEFEACACCGTRRPRESLGHIIAFCRALMDGRAG